MLDASAFAIRIQRERLHEPVDIVVLVLVTYTHPDHPDNLSINLGHKSAGSRLPKSQPDAGECADDSTDSYTCPNGPVPILSEIPVEFGARAR